jgi:hypothetical protein
VEGPRNDRERNPERFGRVRRGVRSRERIASRRPDDLAVKINHAARRVHPDGAARRDGRRRNLDAGDDAEVIHDETNVEPSRDVVRDRVSDALEVSPELRADGRLVAVADRLDARE